MLFAQDVARMGVTSNTTGLAVGLHVRLIPEDLRALQLDLFSMPSDLDFLRNHQD
jgi:hypothetical protein